jgi:membrane-associated phospholipid phosphatase
MSDNLSEKVPVATKKAFYNRVPVVYGFLTILIIAFAILTVYIKFHAKFFLDLPVTLAIQQINFFWFEAFMRFLTEIGNVILGAFITVIAVLFLLLIKQKREAFFLTVSTVGAELISGVFKILVQRPRPDPSLITQLGHYTNSDSFPSGHVLYFIGFYGFLLFLAYTRLKRTWLRRILIIIFTIFIIFIGFSRIYLGAHWFSDVLGSFLIGIVWLYIVIHLFRKSVG